MYSSVTIRRFRCFESLTVGGLQRVNLVTGLNNVGKTTLLEALFLLVGGFNPELPLRVNVLRGIEAVIPTAEEQWGWLFHNHDVNQAIELTCADTDGGRDELRLHLGGPLEFERLTKGQEELPLADSDAIARVPRSLGVPSISTAEERSDLILEFRARSGQPVVTRVAVGRDGRVHLDRSRQNGFRPGAFLATRIRPSAEDADRLSKLKREGRDKQIVAALKPIEPKLQDLTILAQAGQPLIHAEVSGLGLIPIPMFGEGFGRLLSVTLAILTTPRGLVLVDEVENGLHHTVLPGVWEGLRVAAEQANTQVVATTHSQECITAAVGAFSDRHSNDLAVVQLFRLPTGFQARVLDHQHLQAAVRATIDLRGGA